MNGKEVIQYARITYRQLDHWTTRGLLRVSGDVRSPGSGRPRHYTDNEARRAWYMARLLELGLTLEAATSLANTRVNGVTAVTRGGVTIDMLGLDAPDPDSV